MATTPEGKVKRKVSALLKSMPRVYYDMPVPGGFGGVTLDYVACANGRYFAVETKAPGKAPTARQVATMAQMRRAGAIVFVISDDAGVERLEKWLRTAGAHRPIEEAL